MRRSNLNLLIDAAMTPLLAAVAGLGALVKWVLIPGRETVAVYGRRVELTWLGLDRHQWGTVHLALGGVLLALVTVHVALHWAQVARFLRTGVASRPARTVIAVLLILATAALLLFPLITEPEVNTAETLRRGRRRWTPEVNGNSPARDADDGETRRNP